MWQPDGALARAARGQIRGADYVLVHFQRAGYQSAAEEMDRLLALRHTGLRSYCCRMGQYKEIAAKAAARK